MADEIRVTTSMSIKSGTLSVPATTSSVTYDMATLIGPAPGGVVVDVTEALIDFGDVVPSWCEITNLDDTNFVELGFSTGVYGIEVPAGGTVIFKMASGADLYAIADTASCNVNIKGASV